MTGPEAGVGVGPAGASGMGTKGTNGRSPEPTPGVDTRDGAAPTGPLWWSGPASIR